MVMPPMKIDDPDGIVWDDAADVVVLGFGAAGACAALEAHESGASVILVDKFEGGGTTALSGGVVYAGATRFQREAGFEDSTEEMYKYLSMEVGDIISSETLRRFCEESSENLDWLIRHGADYGGRLARPDEAYDAALSAGASLYFSGNECVARYAAVAKPAPRGHITVGPGFGSKGVHLFGALRTAIERSAVKFQPRSPATRLVIDRKGRVVGIEVTAIRRASFEWFVHRLCERLYHKAKGNLYGPPARVLARAIAWSERRGTPLRIRARRGIVLATGGFINNRQMMAEYLPQHLNAIPMGSAGCLGDGIRLGQSVDGLTRMDCGESGRSLLIPRPFKFGLLVNAEGKRFIAEDAYGAKIGHEVFEQTGQAAWLILDAALFREAWGLVMPWKRMILRYRARALMPLLFAWKRSGSIEGLAQKCGVSAAGLRTTFDAYNDDVLCKREDALGKLAPNSRPLGKGPYYAINCSPSSRGFPPLSLTLGGLQVDERTGQVLGAGRPPIEGLYAAGRAAIGLPSNFFISGLSLADCVFSGRRAGRSAAQASPLASAGAGVLRAEPGAPAQEGAESLRAAKIGAAWAGATISREGGTI